MKRVGHLCGALVRRLGLAAALPAGITGITGITGIIGIIGIIGITGIIGVTTACTPEVTDSDAQLHLDTRLETHALLPGTPSEAGLVYVEALASAHLEADEADSPERALDRLSIALELEPPEGDGVAELLHLELAARAGELMLDTDRHQRCLALLEPLLAPARSLPLDRASARALVIMGDAAARSGDHALAMSSYARALEILSLLFEELES